MGQLLNTIDLTNLTTDVLNSLGDFISSDNVIVNKNMTTALTNISGITFTNNRNDDKDTLKIKYFFTI